MVARRHGLPAPGAIAGGVPGSHPVWKTAAAYVVKFFAPHWPDNFEVESGVYAALGAAPGLPVPRMLAQGALYPGGDRWPWPYLVTTVMPGRSVGELRGDLSGRDLLRLAADLAPVVRALHRLPVPASARRWQDRLAWLRQAAVSRRSGEGGWPDELLAGLPAYLDGALGDGLRGPQCLVHADLTEDHALVVPTPTGPRLSGLIDFADALVGDPTYELVALHLSLFQCAHDRLRAFLQAYGSEPAWGADWRRRATACVLIFPFEVMPVLAEHLPTVRAVRTAEDLQERLWPRWP